MTHDCKKCGTPTDSDMVVVAGSVYALCDGCREEFEQMVDGWLAGEEKPPVRGDCENCGGPVELRFRYQGAGRVQVVVDCPTCDWTGSLEEGA